MKKLTVIFLCIGLCASLDLWGQNTHKQQLDNIGTELFRMIRQNDYSELSRYLLNDENYESVIALYGLTSDEEQKYLDQKQAVIQNTFDEISSKFAEAHKHCHEEKNIDWNTVAIDMYTEVLHQENILAGQITFSPGENEWCEFYIYLVKIQDGWMIDAVEL